MYNQPEVALELYADRSRFKMFMGDTGLLATYILQNSKETPEKCYRSLVLDDIDFNQGMICENMVGQMLKMSGYDLYFHEYDYKAAENESVKHYEIDFLIVKGKRIVPIEVKSSDYKNHKSFDYFKEKYQLKMNERYIIYTKDMEWKDDILFMPIYMTMCL